MLLSRTTKLCFSLILLCITSTLDALPQYSRNMNIDCNACHTVRPQITPEGKEFLETAGEALLEEYYGSVAYTTHPFGARFIVLPVDKWWGIDKTTQLLQTDRDLHVASMKDVQFFICGRLEKFFYHGEIKGNYKWADCVEDAKRGFDVRLVKAYVAYPVCDWGVLYLGWASPFVLDGNDTVTHHNVLPRQWNGARFVPGNSQMIGFFRRQGNWTAMAAFHGPEDEKQGRDPQSFSVRGTIDLCAHSFGAYYYQGFDFECEREESVDLVKCVGIDFHLRHEDWNLMFLAATCEELGERDYNFSVEVNYFLEGNCIFQYVIPIVNVDAFTRDGNDSKWWVQTGAGAAFRINPNFKIVPFVQGTLTSPSMYVHREFRAGIQADAGF